MKLNLILALVAVLACAPVSVASAAEKAKPAAAEKAKDDESAEKKTGPTDAEKAKARKMKKPIYLKLNEAKAVAEKADQPILVVIVPEGLPLEFEKKFIKDKRFLKDFAFKNLVLVTMKLKKGATPKKIGTRQMKPDELKFIENFGVNPHDLANAKAYHRPEPVFDDLSNYPAVICVDSLCQKELFRVPRATFGETFGTQFSNFVDLLTNTGIEPDLSPLVKKIVENPDEPKKWK